MTAYTPIVGLVLLALAFVVVMVGLNVIFSPRRYNLAKYDTYECGIEPTSKPASGGRFSIKYYTIAMLYIIFDIEIVFLYPWATSFTTMLPFAVIEMLIFMAMLFVAYFYVYRRGGLDWD